jgi:hypothetical protein
MTESRRDRFYASFVAAGRRRPGRVLVLLLLSFVAGLWEGRDIETNTSRFDMVRRDEPYQARLLGFFERFGHPDAPVLLVRGADGPSRRAAVDDVVEALEEDGRFTGRVLGRVGVRELSSVLLLHRPEALDGLRRSLPADRALADVLEGGLPAWIGAIEASILAGLDDAAPADEAAAREGMARLAALARLLTRALSGSSDLPLSELGLADPEALARAGLDDHGYLVSRDGATHLIAMFPEIEGTRVQDYRPVVEAVRAVQTRAAAEHPDVELWLSGLPVLVVDEDRVLARGALWSSIASAIGILVVLLLAFRSLRSTIYALLPLTIGMGVALGLTDLLVGHLNPITAGMFAILLGVGIDFSVHVLARFQELLAQGTDRATAVREALVRAGPGIMGGGVTSVLAFLSVVPATFTAFSEFGMITAVGLVVVFVCTMYLLPILLDRVGGGQATPIAPGIERLVGLTRRARVPILVVASLLTAAGAFGATRVWFNARYFDFLPEKLESVRALEVLEKDGALSPLFAYASASDLQEARGLTADLRALESVGSVQSPTDMLPDLDAAGMARLRAGLSGMGREVDLRRLAARGSSGPQLGAAVRGVVDALDEVAFALRQAGRSTEALDEARAAFVALGEAVAALPGDGARVAELERELATVLGPALRTASAVAARGRCDAEDLPPLFAARHAARDGSGRIAVFVFPARPIWVEGEAERFAAEVISVAPDAAGHAISMHVHNEMIIADFVRAAVAAVVLVVIVLLLDFRRASDALLALAPVVLGAAWMLGLMAAFDIPFSVANIMVLPFLIGLGVDAGVHMVHRLRQHEAAGGVAPVEALMSGTGAAVLVASVTTIVGFAGLIVADYGAIRVFGLTMVLGIGASLVAALLVLPALLLLVGRAR